MIRIGLLGVGGIAQLSHLPMLQNLDDLYEIAAITDLSPAIRAMVAKKYNVPKVYATAQELLADPDIDAVMVLSPDPLHAQLAIEAMEAGKHVIIEKPLAMNSHDIRRMMAVEAAHPGIIAMVGYMRRFATPFIKAKELLAEDDRPVEYIRFRDIILEGRFFTGQTRRTRRARMQSDLQAHAMDDIAKMKYEQHSVGLGEDATEMQRNVYQMLLGLGCHSFSAVRELIGLPKEVKSILTSKNGTHVVALLQYDGFIGTYEMVNDQNVVQFDAAIEIFQGDRKLKIKYETPYIRWLPHSLEVIESTGTDTKTTIYGPDYHDAFEAELKYFAQCIAEGKTPKTSLADSLQDIELFEKMAKMVVKEG